MSAAPETSLSTLIARYDVFCLDQFGVLRDNEALYDGAVEAVEALKAAGKTVVILSNSGRDGRYNARRIAELGLPEASFDHFVTSGDVGLALLSGPDAPVRPPARCLTVASAGAPGFAAALGMEEAASAADADLVVIAGSEAERVSMDAYADLLRPAAERGVPAICLNPDFQKLWRGTHVPGAGTIADLYERLGGGRVARLGKPYGEIYRHALALCGEPDPSRVVCVGDSIEHDILGARNAGLDSVLVGTGLAAHQSSDEQLAAMEAAGARPTWRLARFALDPDRRSARP